MSKEKKGRSSRICLIVDNPLRDLEGLCLLGCYLSGKNAEVYLVSMSHLHEVYFLRPDLVLLNYVRKANRSFIKRCEELDIMVGVLDTEGGIIQDVDFYFRSVFSHVDKVDLYCFWGRKQHEAMQKINKLPDKLLKVTGCPRYDFCVSPWDETLPQISLSGDKVVLVNTNFPLIQPRFQSAEKEAAQLVSDVGFDKEYVDELVFQYRYARNEVVNIVKCLAPCFKEAIFVIRPHPFEDKTFYEDTFSELSNVEVHQSGSVFPWIKRSMVLLHYNCSTAVEAVLMGKEPIHLWWLKAPLLEQKSSVKISHCPRSLDELRHLLKRVLKGQKLDTSEEKKAARKKVISDWFYSNDGKNSERVANAILEKINNLDRRDISKYDYFKILLVDTLMKRDFKAFLKHLLLLVLGANKYGRLKKINYSSGKEFNVQDVHAIVERIEKVAPSTGYVTVDSKVDTKRYVVYSVRLMRDC